MAPAQLAVQPGAPLSSQQVRFTLSKYLASQISVSSLSKYLFSSKLDILQHPLLHRAAMAGRVGGSGSSIGSDSEDRSDSEVVLKTL